VILANPTFDDKALENAARSIDEILNAPPNLLLYLKERATRDPIIEQAGECGVLHVIAHGDAPEDEPLRACALLYLRRDGEQIIVDRFEIIDVFTLFLRQTTLVNWTNCFLGKLSARGSGCEELIGMARASFAAGTPTVIAALWAAHIPASARLMPDFYQVWKNQSSHDKAEALRQAMLNLKKEKEFSHPHYWAPFVLMGDWM
jgi:CHAT domain-containing protein